MLAAAALSAVVLSVAFTGAAGLFDNRARAWALGALDELKAAAAAVLDRPGSAREARWLHD